MSSSSSSSSDEDESAVDPDILRARAIRRKRRLFERKHLDRVWNKWAKYGKHGFLSSDEDGEIPSDGAQPKKKTRVMEGEAKSYAAYDSD